MQLPKGITLEQMIAHFGSEQAAIEVLFSAAVLKEQAKWRAQHRDLMYMPHETREEITANLARKIRGE